MNPNWLDNHLNDILKYQQELNQLADDQYIIRIEILSKILVLVGKLASHFSGLYKRTYAERKRRHAEAYIRASRNKAAEAELAVAEIRIEEAEAYENMKRWGNAFESTREEINALKYKLKVDMADGSSNDHL